MGWITNANDLDAVLARVVEQNCTAYALAYESPVSTTPGPHRIEVRVRRAGARVFARSGYVVTSTDAHARDASTVLRETLGGSASRGTLPIRLHVVPQFAVNKTGTAVVTVSLDHGGQSKQPIDVALLTIDERGRTAYDQVFRVAPPPPGWPWELTTEVTLAPGRHQLRVAAVTEDAIRTGLVLASIEIVEPRGDLAMTPPVLLSRTEGRVHPTASRTFVIGTHLGVQTEVAGRAVQENGVAVTLTLLDSEAVPVRTTAGVLDSGRLPHRARATSALTTAGLAPGRYTLVMEATPSRQNVLPVR